MHVCEHAVHFEDGWVVGRSVGSVELPGERGDASHASVVDESDDAYRQGDGTQARCGVGLERGGRNRAKEPEQKRVSWRKELVVKFRMGG